MHDLTLSDCNGTNNFAKAWNRRFQTLVSHNNPTVWKTIEVLGDDAAEAATAMLRHTSGRMEPRCVRRNVNDFNKKRRNLCKDYDSGGTDLRIFLRAVEHRTLHATHWLTI